MSPESRSPSVLLPASQYSADAKMRFYACHRILLYLLNFLNKFGQHQFSFITVSERSDVITFPGVEVPEAGATEYSIGALEFCFLGICLAMLLGVVIIHGKLSKVGVDFLFSTVVDHGFT